MPVKKTATKPKVKAKKKPAAKSAAPVKRATAKKATKKSSSDTKASQVKKDKPKKSTKESTKETPSVKNVKAFVPDKLVELSKQDVIVAFEQKSGDTGSPEVQVALSTQKIYNLTKHLELNPKDNHSRRGLLKIISKRRRIFHYLQNLDEKRYKELINKLGLKK